MEKVYTFLEFQCLFGIENTGLHTENFSRVFNLLADKKRKLYKRNLGLPLSRKNSIYVSVWFTIARAAPVSLASTFGERDTRTLTVRSS